MSVSSHDPAGNAPPLLNLTTQQLQYLAAIGSGKTLGETAERLQISQSALSQGLSELERKLSLTLFERRGRSRVLTEVGRQAVAHSERILAATRDFTIWAEAMGTGALGRVRLGLIDIAAVNYFPDTLTDFKAWRPDIELHLNVAPSAALTRQVLAGQLDVAVIVEPTGADYEDLLVEPLLTEDLAIYAPGPNPSSRSGHRLGPAATWGPWITFPPDSHTRRQIARALRAAGAEFHVAAESHQPEVVRQLVNLGMGWTVLPVIQAEAEPSPLVRARRQPLLTRSLVIARRASSSIDPATEHLVGRLKADARRFQSTA